MTAGMQEMEHVLGGYAARLCHIPVQEQHQSAGGAPAGDAASNMRSRAAHGTVWERPICHGLHSGPVPAGKPVVGYYGSTKSAAEQDTWPALTTAALRTRKVLSTRQCGTAHGLALVVKQCAINLPNGRAHGPQNSVLRGVNSQDNICQLLTAWPQKALCCSQVAVSESCHAIFPPFISNFVFSRCLPQGMSFN